MSQCMGKRGFGHGLVDHAGHALNHDKDKPKDPKVQQVIGTSALQARKYDSEPRHRDKIRQREVAHRRRVIPTIGLGEGFRSCSRCPWMASTPSSTSGLDGHASRYGYRRRSPGVVKLPILTARKAHRLQ